MSNEKEYDPKSMVGKTIAAVKGIGAELTIRFTDDSVIVVQAEVNYDCASLEYDDPSDWQLLGVGAIDQAEYDRRAATHKAKMAAREEASERRRFEELSKKFAPK